MNSRRDFLGQVLGTLVASRVPFYAIEAKPYIPVSSKLNELERIIEVLKAPDRLKKCCRLILRLDDDTLLEGPRMSHIERPSATEFGFFAEDFEAARAFTLKGFQFINWKNQFVNERLFERGYASFMGPEELRADWYSNSANAGRTPPPKWGGDTLKASYIINIGF
jgi:hypothetical protein